MGTRAIITKDGYPVLSVQYDGHPDCLGADLRKVTSDTEIYQVAESHVVVFADGQFMTQLCSAQADKKQYTNIHTCGEWFDYQYDLKDGEWRFRKLSGRWPDPIKGKWIKWVYAKADGIWLRSIA